MIINIYSERFNYRTKHLEIHILGGLKTNKLESLRVTISIQKPKQHNILRHNIDLYNDNQVENFTRKIAERLEIGTSVVRKTLQELTNELENYRFLLLEQYEQEQQPYYKTLTKAVSVISGGDIIYLRESYFFDICF